MILRKACMIDTETAINAPEWGLYDGAFCWITGRPGYPYYAVMPGFYTTGPGAFYTGIDTFSGSVVEVSINGLTPAIVGAGLDFDVVEGGTIPCPYVSNIHETETGVTMNINGLTPALLGAGLNFDIEGDEPANPPNNPVTGTPQLEWKEGILAREAFAEHDLACKIGIGGYSTMGKLTVNIAKPGFFQFLKANGINLSNKWVRAYLETDGVWSERGVFVIDAQTAATEGDSLSCIDPFKVIHTDVPPEVVTLEEFPESTEAEREQSIPAILGAVPAAPLIGVSSEKSIVPIYKNGSVERTVTGATLINDRSTSVFPNPRVALIIGPNLSVSFNQFVGYTLVGYDSEKTASRQIVSNSDPFTLNGFRVIYVYYSLPFQDLFAEDPMPPRRWRSQFATDNDDTAFEADPPTNFESWSFEIWGGGVKRLISDKPIKSFVGVPKVVSEGALENSPVLDIVEDTDMDGRAGVELFVGDAARPEIAEKEYIRERLRPTSVKLALGDVPTIGAFGMDLPRLYDLINLDTAGYYYEANDGTLGSADPRWLRILVEVEIPDDLELADGDSVYAGADFYFSGEFDLPQRVATTQAFMRACAVTQSGKVSIQPADYNLVPTHLINRPVNYDGDLLAGSSVGAAVNGRVFTLPPDYFTGATGGFVSPIISIAGNYAQTTGGVTTLVGFNDGKYGAEVLDVTEAFRGNKTKTVFVEVSVYMTFSATVTGTLRLRFSELGFYVVRKSLTIPERLFYSAMGDLYGSAWSGRRTTTDPVLGLTDMAEHLIRSYDGRPDMVDETSFNIVNNYRPASGPFGWFAGRQLSIPTNTVELLDEICQNAMLLMVPGWDGKRRIISWMDEKNTSAPELDVSRWVEDTIRIARESQSADIYSEFDLSYDYNYGTGKYNKRLAVLRTSEASFPAESGIWQQYVIGVSNYNTAKSYWEAAKQGFTVTGNTNRLTLTLPWLTDQFNGDPWSAAFAEIFQTVPTTSPAERLLSALLSWATTRKRVATGTLAMTDDNIELRLGDCIIFTHPEFTNNVRYYGWVTNIAGGDAGGIKAEIMWIDANGPDASTGILTYEDGSSGGFVAYDDGVESGLIEIKES